MAAVAVPAHATDDVASRLIGMAQAYRAKAAAFGAKASRPDPGDGGETVLAGGVDAQKVLCCKDGAPSS